MPIKKVKDFEDFKDFVFINGQLRTIYVRREISYSENKKMANGKNHQILKDMYIFTMFRHESYIDKTFKKSIPGILDEHGLHTSVYIRGDSIAKSTKKSSHERNHSHENFNEQRSLTPICVFRDLSPRNVNSWSVILGI